MRWYQVRVWRGILFTRTLTRVPSVLLPSSFPPLVPPSTTILSLVNFYQTFRHSEPFRNQISFAADRDGSAAESVGGQPRLVAFRHVDGCGFCGRVGIPHYTLPDGRLVHLYE